MQRCPDELFEEPKTQIQDDSARLARLNLKTSVAVAFERDGMVLHALCQTSICRLKEVHEVPKHGDDYIICHLPPI